MIDLFRLRAWKSEATSSFCVLLSSPRLYSISARKWKKWEERVEGREAMKRTGRCSNDIQYKVSLWRRTHCVTTSTNDDSHALVVLDAHTPSVFNELASVRQRLATDVASTSFISSPVRSLKISRLSPCWTSSLSYLQSFLPLLTIHTWNPYRV